MHIGCAHRPMCNAIPKVQSKYAFGFCKIVPISLSSGFYYEDKMQII